MHGAHRRNHAFRKLDGINASRRVGLLTRDSMRSTLQVAKVFCIFYTYEMASRSKPKSVATFSLKLGTWLEATATGWGIIAVPVVILLVVCVAALRYALE